MAREHRPDDRPLHPGRVLTGYPIAVIEDGPWPGRLALGPVPAEPDAPAAIAAWGAVLVLGLTADSETATLGVPDLATHLASAGVSWIGAPIEDFGVPDSAFLQEWPVVRDRLIDRLQAGEKILVHCRAGLGRSGMIVAALLIAGGMQPEAAIRTVRRFRPGAIETAGQEAWLRGGTGPAR